MQMNPCNCLTTIPISPFQIPQKTEKQVTPNFITSKMLQQQLIQHTETPAPPPPPPPPLPPGLTFFPALALGPPLRFHRSLVLFLTFAAYAAFHASRKPPSIVKSVLTAPIHQTLPLNSAELRTGWAPFDSPGSVGELDLLFLLAYAIGMYFAGHVGDRFDLRILLTIGMVGSGVCVVLFGLGYFLDLHSFGFFVIVQVACGLFQSIGWPCVVAVVGNWFGEARRGFIMGAWSSHTSVGNIIGSLVASSVLAFGWGWCFVIPGFLIILLAAFVFLFLVVRPECVGLQLPPEEVAPATLANPPGGAEEVPLINPVEEAEPATVADSQGSEVNAEEQPLNNPEGSGMNAEEQPLNNPEGSDGQPEGEIESATTADPQGGETNAEQVPLTNPEGGVVADGQPAEGSGAIGFLGAWNLPHVKSYAICLFFSKLVAYTLLYWLPFYIRDTAVAGVHLSDKTAGSLSAIFDLGGVFGGIAAGYISDMFEASACTSALFLVLSMPILILYRLYGSISMPTHILLMFASGFLVSGPYSLISTAVAADLGTQTGDPRALATVTAIIDGTGSLGAAIGPLLAGYISPRGWNSVFYMLIASILIALCCLIDVVQREISAMQRQGQNTTSSS